MGSEEKKSGLSAKLKKKPLKKKEKPHESLVKEEAAKQEQEQTQEQPEEQKQEQEQVQEQPQEPKTEPVKKAGRNSKAEKPKQEITRVATTEIDFLEAAKRVAPQFEDKQWNKYKAEIEKAAKSIVIPSDANPGTMREVAASLADLHQRISLVKSEYDNLLYNINSIVETVQKTNMGEARNDMERRKNGLMACMQYEDEDGVTMNLLEVQAEVHGRQNFLQSVMNDLKYKRDLMNNMSSTLKLEKGLGDHE